MGISKYSCMCGESNIPSFEIPAGRDNWTYFITDKREILVTFVLQCG